MFPDVPRLKSHFWGILQTVDSTVQFDDRLAWFALRRAACQRTRKCIGLRAMILWIFFIFSCPIGDCFVKAREC